MDYSKEKLFSQQKDFNEKEQLFSSEKENAKNGKLVQEENEKLFWQVLIVDDEEDIHFVTKMALKGFVHQDREIRFIHAYSGVEARDILKNNHDIALILLDVVMESSHAGLDLVKYIRDELKNAMVQIVLRTGYPGQVPEREAIVSYEINDYKTKTELTSFKLFTVTLAGIRAYNSLKQLDNLRRSLEDKVKERTLELEKKNVQIMEMDQMKTRFFSNISHEIRTPLTLINGPLEDMLVKGICDESERERVELMYRNSLRILGLVNQLMDLSKIDAGSLKLELVDYNVIKVLKMIARSFVPLSERKKITYEMDFPKEEINTYFDYDKLEKILSNLLSNAFRFTPEGGRIQCSVRIVEEIEGQKIQGIRLSVEDSGPGIPFDQQEKIFDRFFQVEGSWQHSSGGTGIGLSLTRELVDLMHGKIHLRSSEKGSVFSLVLPLGKQHLNRNEFEIVDENVLKEFPLMSKAGVSKAGVSNAGMSNAGMPEDGEEALLESGKDRVLIIDDNEDIRTHIKHTLGAAYDIFEAENGKDGIDQAKNLIPDLIILDWMMPVMEGLEVCKIVRDFELTSHIPILMLTAKADVKDKLEGLQTGADDYITKPFNGAELAAKVQNFIRQRKKLMEPYSKHHDIDPKEIAVNSVDERFLSKARDIIEQNMGDSDFDVNTFYPEMGMSRMQLFRKIKATTNQSPSELIRNYRLKRAAQLLECRFGNIAEVTYEVGFNNLSYFARCFKEKYGQTPSEYIKREASALEASSRDTPADGIMAKK